MSPTRKINDKFAHKLDFLENMRCYFAERFALGDDQQILVGDFNIAPHEHDVWGHKQLLKLCRTHAVEVGILETLRKPMISRIRPACSRRRTRSSTAGGLTAR